MKKILITVSLAWVVALGLFVTRAVSAETPPKPPEMVLKADLDHAVAERDKARQQLAEAQTVANVFKAQRNELASNVLDLNATVAALQAEIKRLTPDPTAAK